jgi:hypothetical protein
MRGQLIANSPMSFGTSGLKGFEERIGSLRPWGESYSRDFRGPNWLDRRKSACSCGPPFGEHLPLLQYSLHGGILKVWRKAVISITIPASVKLNS